MSDKLKIMQHRVSAKVENLENEFYQFNTCCTKTYYVEVPARAGILGALEKLEQHFGIGGNDYCHGCECSKIIFACQITKGMKVEQINLSAEVAEIDKSPY